MTPKQIDLLTNLVRRLRTNQREVEPPADFTDRVMRSVRRSAGVKSESPRFESQLAWSGALGSALILLYLFAAGASFEERFMDALENDQSASFLLEVTQL